MPRSLALIALALVVTLTGCTPSTPAPTETAAPSAEPLFASDDEALAAAEALLESYWSTVNVIRQEGGANPQRISPYVTETWLVGDLATLNRFEEAKSRQTGEITFDSLSLEQRFTEETVTTVLTNICVDYSGRQTLDESGTIVDSPDAATRAPYRVTLVSSDQSELGLLLDDVEVWQGHSC